MSNSSSSGYLYDDIQKRHVVENVNIGLLDKVIAMFYAFGVQYHVLKQKGWGVTVCFTIDAVTRSY